MNRTIKFALSGAAAALILGATVIPAHAEATPPIDPNTLAQLTANFDLLGVDPAKQEGLLEKYADGESFDNAESSGVKPVSKSAYHEGITDYKREVYPDGSVTLTSVEHPTKPTKSSDITPYGISGCTYSLNTGVASYRNCQIYKNNVVLTEWFHADYYQYSGGAGASLTNTWDWDIQAAGGACSKDYLGTPTSTKARIRAYCTVVTGIGSTYPNLDLDVTKTSATVNANW